MKMIVALFHPQQLPAVKQALIDAQITHFTVTNARGTAPKHEQMTYRGVGREIDLFHRVRLDIGVSEAFVDPCLEALRRGAQESGGHGKIFVLELLDVLEISGRRGPKAL